TRVPGKSATPASSMRASTASPKPAMKTSSMRSRIIVPPLPWASRMWSWCMEPPQACGRVKRLRLAVVGVAVVRGAGALRGDHARPDGVFRRAASGEELALVGQHGAAKNVAALAAANLTRLRRRDRHALEGVEGGELRPDGETGAGDDAQAPPLGVRWLEDLVDRGARDVVPLGHDGARVRDLDLCAALRELLREHPDTLEYVDRFEAGDRAGDPVA